LGLFITICYLRSGIAGDYYVSLYGEDRDYHGRAPETPWQTITYALTRVSANSFDPAIIHVAPGTYSASTTGESFPLRMKSWVSLQGVGADSTIIDTEYVPDIRTILCENANNFKIDGFTITGGSGSGSYPEDVGGIIRCLSSSPIISNNKIVNNRAGGIWCHSSSPTITNNIISNNNVFDSGAGIFCCDNSSPTITGNTIADNRCQSIFYEGGGGGIACFKSSPLIISNTIIENVAVTGPSNEGGGIFCTEVSNPIIGGAIENGNNIYDNKGSGKGNDLFRLGIGNTINAQYNYFNSVPTWVEVYSLNQFDVSNYKNPPVHKNHQPVIEEFFPLSDTTITEIDTLMLL
jgi:parallel beta-helix repeat protein